MISTLFNTFIYNPLYNALIYFVDLIPNHDVGIAVVLLTIVVRLVIYPLSKRAIKAQADMRRVVPDIDAIKEKYKDNKEEQSKAIFALYKEKDIHPFAGFILALIQLPILLALYWIFARSGLPVVMSNILYSFVHTPITVNMNFLGFLPMKGHSIILAITAATTQLLYTRLSLGPTRAHTIESESSFSKDMAKSMDTQARYVLPLMIGVIAYSVNAAAPLYWTISNSFMLAQEYLSGRRFHDTHE